MSALWPLLVETSAGTWGWQCAVCGAQETGLDHVKRAARHWRKHCERAKHPGQPERFAATMARLVEERTG